MPNVCRLLVVLALSHVAVGQATMSVQMNKPEKATVGLPYSADQKITVVQHLAGGTNITSQVSGHIYRSASGVERIDGALASTDGTGPTVLAYIVDRPKHTVTLLNMKLKTATIDHVPENSTVTVKFLPLQQPRNLPQSKPVDYVTTDLGKRMQGMISLVGSRVSGTIPAGKVGNDQPLTVTADVWVDPQLKLRVNEVEQNPIAGDRTFVLSNIHSDEPDPVLFEVPDGFTVKDKPPMATSLAGIPMTPEMREKQIPAALASTDPFLKNSVAYSLAVNDSHLDDAQTLAEDAVKGMEEASTMTAKRSDRDALYKQSIDLTSYWDTLGWVYFRQGKLDKAEAYLLASWKLKPNSEYALHLGAVYEAQKRPTDAAAIYRFVLNPKSHSTQQSELNARLAKLDGVLVEDVSKEITAALPGFSDKLDAEPVVDILIAAAGTPVVRYVSGEPAKADSLTHAIQAAVAGSLPDSGPETILRRARVSCEAKSCSLHFIVPGK